jgi:hypothetical protein
LSADTLFNVNDASRAVVCNVCAIQAAGFTHIWLPPPSQSVSPEVSISGNLLDNEKQCDMLALGFNGSTAGSCLVEMSDTTRLFQKIAGHQLLSMARCCNIVHWQRRLMTSESHET